MSAIGDYAYYVHYWAADAMKNVPTQKSEMTSYALNKVQNRSRQLHSKVGWKVKQKYADALAGLHNRNTINSSQSINKVQSAVEQLLLSKFNNAILDFDTGRVFTTANNGKVTSSKRKNTTYIATNKVAQIKADVINLQNNMQKIGKANNLSQQEIEKFLTQLERITKLLDEDYKKSKQYTRDEVPGFKAQDENIIYFKTSTELRDLLRVLNHNLAIWGYGTNISTAAMGFSEEAISLAASYMAAGLVGKELDNALKNGLKTTSIKEASTSSFGGLVGAVSSNYEFYVNGIPADALDKTYLSYSNSTSINTPLGQARTITKNTGAQQKIDVIIQLPEMENSPILKSIPASVKNIDLSKDFGIHLVSGTNLFYLLSDENPKYLRKIFNVLAERKGSIIGESAPEKELQARTNLADLRQEAWLSIKYISAYKALSGDTFQRDAASLFIVNDNGGKNTYVLEIADIMNLIYKSVYSNISAIDNYFKIDYSPKLFFNEWQPDVSTRMAKFINDIHRRKISVAFQNSAFNNIIKKAGVVGLKA